MPSATNDSFALTEEQKKHWLQHGFIKIEQAFSREDAEAFTSTVWTRLGMSPTDKSTWTAERTNMPSHTTISVAEFAPKAWAAICELVGGEDRIVDWAKEWRDGFIVNLGKPEFNADDELNYRELDNWHNDGDFFIHFLDSPEQALLIIPLFTDIETKAGGTAICTDGIGLVAKHLYDHPDGLTPFMTPRGTPGVQIEDRREFWNGLIRNPALTHDETFHEATGKVGDVYLLHPFMLHSASRNLKRYPRIITNPPVALQEPFNYNREDASQYSLVELKTLQDLGYPEGLPEWHITGPRERIVPARLKGAEEMKRRELERLQKQGVAVTNVQGAKVSNHLYPSEK